MACTVAADEQEVLRQMLSDMSDDSLRQMGARIARSQQAAESALDELEAEKESLRGENAQLNGTIDFMMRELRKLNISAVNLTEPQIAGETAIDFVGRMWEMMRPRDNTVTISEHVAELRVPPNSCPRSPKASDQLREKVAGHIIAFSGAFGQVTNNIMGSPQEVIRAQELGTQLSARSRQVADHFTALYSSFGQAPGSSEAPKEKKAKKGGKKQSKKASGDGANDGGAAEFPSTPPRSKALHKQLSRETRKLQAEVTKHFEGAWSLLSGVASSPMSAAPAATTPRKEANADEEATGAKGTPAVRTLLGYWRSPGWQQDVTGVDKKPMQSEAPASSGSSTAASSAPASRENSGEGSPHAAAVGVAVGSAKETEAPAAPQPAPAAADVAQPPVDSTLLIQVKLKLGDGSVQTVQVRAADRCKEVAARFVRENSLKAWFEAPLRAYLMEAEDSAERFPVMLEADLMEIRRLYNAAK